jgi:hypothetical protein
MSVQWLLGFPFSFSRSRCLPLPLSTRLLPVTVAGDVRAGAAKGVRAGGGDADNGVR